MEVQAELSIYPLRQSHLTEPIQKFVEGLARDNLYVKAGTMSSVVKGDAQVVFNSIQRAFVEVAESGEIVLTMKVSNACNGSRKS